MIVTIVTLAAGIFLANVLTSALNVILMYISYRQKRNELSEIDALINRFGSGLDDELTKPSVN